MVLLVAHGVMGLLLELLQLIKVEVKRKELPFVTIEGGGGRGFGWGWEVVGHGGVEIVATEDVVEEEEWLRLQ